MLRKNEYFGLSSYGEGCSTIMSTVKCVFRQERDWTCSLASFRTLLSGYLPLCDILSEDEYISKYNITKGPYNSRDMYNTGLLDIVPYKAGFKYPCPETNQAVFLTDLLEDHNVMIECMINAAHWIVLLGYVKLGSLEDDYFIYYDPYYHQVRNIIADELITMWYDVGTSPLQRDYIAVPKYRKEP